MAGFDNLVNTDAQNPGPRVLGHEPVVLPDQREKLVRTVESTGVVNFRNRRDPALPWFKKP